MKDAAVSIRTGRGAVMALAALAMAAVLAALAPACDKLPDPRGNLPEGGSKPAQGNTSGTLTPPHYAAFVVTSDYSLTGGFGVIGLDDLSSYSPDPVEAANIVSPDPVVTSSGDYIYVLNRYTYDSVSVLDKNFGLVNQYSVADASCDPSNPQDMAVVDDNKAYVTLYECDFMLIVNPLTGARLGTVDLSAYGDVDGIPEAGGMLLHGSTLYVAVQMLDRNAGYVWGTPVQGRLVTIDTATDAITGDIELAGRNPITDPSYSDSLGGIVIGSAGSYFATGDFGGIELVDPGAGLSLGFLIDEIGLNGNLDDFEILDKNRGYATITTDDFRSRLVGFDPSTGARDAGDVYTASDGFALWDIALSDGGKLLLCDRTAAAPGIVVFDAINGDNPLTAVPIDLGLPPFSIALLR